MMINIKIKYTENKRDIKFIYVLTNLKKIKQDENF